MARKDRRERTEAKTAESRAKAPKAGANRVPNHNNAQGHLMPLLGSPDLNLEASLRLVSKTGQSVDSTNVVTAARVMHVANGTPNLVFILPEVHAH